MEHKVLKIWLWSFTRINKMDKLKYEVLGLVETIYIGKTITGHNCEFTTTLEPYKKHKIYLKRGNLIYCISLEAKSVESSSGWCSGTTASLNFEIVNNITTLTHVPNKPLTMPLIGWEEDEVETNVFEFSADGGNMYYPEGFYTIKMDLFKPTPRYKDKRVVYIFTGKSGIGKSYVGSNIGDGMSVYETDSNKALPAEIWEDVIVLGNAGGFTVEEVKQRIVQPASIVVCAFEEG